MFCKRPQMPKPPLLKRQESNEEILFHRASTGKLWEVKAFVKNVPNVDLGPALVIATAMGRAEVVEYLMTFHTRIDKKHLDLSLVQAGSLGQRKCAGLILAKHNRVSDRAIAAARKGGDRAILDAYIGLSKKQK